MTTDELDLDVRGDARGRKAEQSDRTRATLVRVARELFADRGYEGTTVGDIVAGG
ncbi:MAG: TetR family transcriptional regulator, partial [Dehalococcoidia bacterium]